jgi:beta-glucosidase-like glycosyl hydrolase
VTRLQVPVLYHINAIHRRSFWSGATIGPGQLGQVSVWEEARVKRSGQSLRPKSRTHPRIGCFCSCFALRVICGEANGRIKCHSALIHSMQGNGITVCPTHLTGYSETQRAKTRAKPICPSGE